MTLQWTLVATFLYAEIAVCLLLLLPFISAKRWKSIFNSRIFNAITAYANYYFMVFMLILVILFADAIRDVRNYSQALHVDENKITPNTETSLHMKLFRAQRNLYIAGFALFLFLVLRRLVVLINRQATLLAECEASKKQAESATAAAKRFMEDQENKTNESGDIRATKEIEEAKAEIAKLKEKLNLSLTDLEAMKQQSEATSREYDRLLDEHAKLQEQVGKLEGTSTSKKDE